MECLSTIETSYWSILSLSKVAGSEHACLERNCFFSCNIALHIKGCLDVKVSVSDLQIVEILYSK